MSFSVSPQRRLPRWPSVHQAVTLKTRRMSSSSFVRLADYATLPDQYDEQFDDMDELVRAPMEADMKSAFGTITNMVDTLNFGSDPETIPERSPLRVRPLQIPPRSVSCSSLPSSPSSLIESTTGSETYSVPDSASSSQFASKSVSVADEDDETEPHPEDNESQLHPAYRRRPFSVYSQYSSASSPPPLSPCFSDASPSVSSSYSSDSLPLSHHSVVVSASPRSSISTYATIAASSPWGTVAKPEQIEFHRRSTAGKPIASMYDLRTSSLDSDAALHYGDIQLDLPVPDIPIPERSQKRSASRMTKNSRRSSKFPGGNLFRRILARN